MIVEYTEQDFWGALNNRRARSFKERYGQSFFNALYAINPRLADSIRGVYNLDPFYEDGQWAEETWLNLYKYIKENW